MSQEATLSIAQLQNEYKQIRRFKNNISKSSHDPQTLVNAMMQIKNRINQKVQSNLPCLSNYNQSRISRQGGSAEHLSAHSRK